MGSAVKSLVKSVKKNPVKAATMAIGGVGPASFALAGDAIKKAASKKGDHTAPQLAKQPFDISKQGAKYEQLAQSQRIRNLKANQRLTDSLEQQARGEGPSLATAQLKSAQTRNLAQTLSAAQTAGASPLNTRQLIQQRGQSGRELAETGASMRMQEQQSAQQQLGQQLGQQANIARGDIAQGFDLSTAPQQMQQQYELERFKADVARQNGIKEQQTAMMGSLLGAGGQVGAAALKSDEKSKKNVKSGKPAVQDFLDKLSAQQYEYKEPSADGAAAGERVGVMAQDVEKSTLGQTLVKNTAEGKQIDTVQGFGAVLAAQAELNKRLNALEGRKPSKKKV